jgi:hypothetical protein
MVAMRCPNRWLGHISQARSLVADGKFEDAIKEVRASQPQAPPNQKANLEGMIKRLENLENINS